MNKLSKTKRDHLILVAMGTVIAIAALYFYVIAAQKEKLVEIETRTREMTETNKLVDIALRKGDEIEAQMENAKHELEKREATLAPDRDSYAWILQTVNAFNSRHHGVSIPAPSQPETSEMKLLPKFYCKAATFHVKGTAFYHDFGRFIADFENEFPYFYLQNLELVPAMVFRSSNTASDALNDAEKLTVAFDIVAPIRPSVSN